MVSVCSSTTQMTAARDAHLRKKKKISTRVVVEGEQLSANEGPHVGAFWGAGVLERHQGSAMAPTSSDSAASVAASDWVGRHAMA